jgi:hypothetical protein
MTQNEKEYHRKEEELRWLLVDLDNTIAHSSYPDFKLQNPIEGAKKFLDKLVTDGWKIIIYTARSWTEYELIEAWLDKNEMPFRRIVCGKPLGRFSIDDRNLEFNGSWEQAYNRLQEAIKN